MLTAKRRVSACKSTKKFVTLQTKMEKSYECTDRTHMEGTLIGRI
jgi:hypothetical protein